MDDPTEFFLENLLSSTAMRTIAKSIVLALIVAGPYAMSTEPQAFDSTNDPYQEQKQPTRRDALGQYNAPEPEKSEPLPWRLLVFVGLTLAVASPFAWQAYLRMARELENKQENNIEP